MIDVVLLPSDDSSEISNLLLQLIVTLSILQFPSSTHVTLETFSPTLLPQLSSSKVTPALPEPPLRFLPLLPPLTAQCSLPEPPLVRNIGVDRFIRLRLKHQAADRSASGLTSITVSQQHPKAFDLAWRDVKSKRMRQDFQPAWHWCRYDEDAQSRECCRKS